MDVAFILDPLPELKAYKDSSIAMMRALERRGHRIFALGQADIFWDAGVTRGSRARADAVGRRPRLVSRRASPRHGRSRISPR